ncbi:MAG: serine/threonine-protein kinase [Candidatus Sedimenticola sp. (ex Thyasira tokunagai)]
MLGRGATASVYLAEDPFTNVEVAIKIAHQSVMDDPETGYRFKKMFMNEASLAGKLRHPHIVSVYDAGVEHDMHYIVMEYVAGSTLKEFCKPEKLLPTDDVIEIIFKCCNALEHAHLFGLIHRDIKPGNILTTGGTDVKISDFGTALLTNSELTQVMDAVGTPSYMSPEQLSNQTLSQQTDIYSLGVVMYQLLSGKLPFKASNQYELIQKITHQPPAPLESVRSGLPDGVVDIVNRCLNKDLDKRYNSWMDVAHDLSAAHEQLNISSAVEVSDSRKFNILKTLSFFKEFTDVELWEMLRISKWRYFKAARTLLEEGKIGGSIFILASGDARIMKNDAFLGVIETGQCFGEMAYIYGMKKPRTASVVSNSQVTVIKIKSEALQRASIELQTKFNKELLRTLAERLEKTSVMASSI